MPPRVLEFYFDVISHNAYLAWHELPALAARHDLKVVAVPVVFGAILSAHGQLGPAEVPAKSAWMIRDVLRKAAQLNIEINPPAVHPFNPLLTLRAITAITAEEPRQRLTEAIFRAVWVTRQDVTDPAVVQGIVAACGLDVAAVMHAVNDPRIKTALRAQTDQAIARGVFGVPTMRVGDELFWGFDDFAPLEDFLSGSDPLDRAVVARWRAVRPGVQRKR